MAQIILTFGLGKEKIKVVRSIAQKNRIQIKEISRKDYNQKLGALAGIQGFAKEKVIYNGPDFPLEMIVFSGIDSAQIDSFLADYKQTGAYSSSFIFNTSSFIISDNSVFTYLYRDMLPPLKSLILKWGLLAQWLYRAKYLQAILACPAIFISPVTDFLLCCHAHSAKILFPSFMMLTAAFTSRSILLPHSQ